MLIGSVMSHRVVTCRVGDTLEHVAQLMWDHDIGFLPVVDRNDRLVGVVTDRDALMAAYTRGTHLRASLVDTAMARDPVSCSPHSEATEIEHVMARHQIRRVPVVDEANRPIGVVTLSDLARASQFGHELSPKGPTHALVEITRPRCYA
jgi:CBS domain-containing protein